MLILKVHIKKKKTQIRRAKKTLQKKSNGGPALPDTKAYREVSTAKALAHEQTQIQGGFSVQK